MATNAATVPESQADLNEKYENLAVETAIKKIEAAYRLGLKSIEKHGESLQSKRNGIIPAFATEKGLRRDTVERARQFARVFTKTDLRQICRECRKHNFPLGVTLIYRVLPLRDADRRMQLLRQAIRKRWTQRRMIAEIHTRTGAKTRSGRPRALPKNSAEACLAIVSRIVPVLRWLEELKSSKEAQLGANLRGKIDKAVIALEALVKAAS
jgi:hypothetical protein